MEVNSSRTRRDRGHVHKTNDIETNITIIKRAAIDRHATRSLFDVCIIIVKGDDIIRVQLYIYLT